MALGVDMAVVSIGTHWYPLVSDGVLRYLLVRGPWGQLGVDM